jgi:hypothetical protein
VGVAHTDTTGRRGKAPSSRRRVGRGSKRGDQRVDFGITRYVNR